MIIWFELHDFSFLKLAESYRYTFSYIFNLSTVCMFLVFFFFLLYDLCWFKSIPLLLSMLHVILYLRQLHVCIWMMHYGYKCVNELLNVHFMLKRITINVHFVYIRKFIFYYEYRPTKRYHRYQLKNNESQMRGKPLGIFCSNNSKKLIYLICVKRYNLNFYEKLEKFQFNCSKTTYGFPLGPIEQNRSTYARKI